jgi:SET domain-containing protein
MTLLVNVYLKQSKKGLGIFACNKIKKNQVLWIPTNLRTFTIEELEKMPTPQKKFIIKYACSLSDGTKYVDNDFALFWNHSCEPNTKLLVGNKDVRIAARDIEPNEELTYDYFDDKSGLEEDGFTCLCGSPKCRGYIRKERE